MSVDNDKQEAPDSTGQEENPFEQEEVFPMGDQQVQNQDPPAVGEGVGYMPEDAVIEYGYDSGDDFYDPYKNKEGEEDSVFMTEESSKSGAQQEPAPEADLTSAIDSDPLAGYEKPSEPDGYANQLDSMFPDDGFKKGGELNWDSSAKTEPTPAMPPVPPPPPMPGAVTPGSVTEEMYEEGGVPDSPSGYVVITPSGRKKGLSPEIAQLLDRTSKRQTTVQAIEDGTGSGKKNGVVVAILIVLILAAAGTAGYFFSELQKARKEIGNAETKSLQAQAQLKSGYEARIGELDTAQKAMQVTLEEKDKAYDDYVENVKGQVAQFESLDKARLNLEGEVKELKEENTKIGKLENELEDRDGQITALNSDVHAAKKEAKELTLGIFSRDSKIADIEDQLANNEERITKLREKLEEISTTATQVSLSELAKLRDTVMKQENKIESLSKWNGELEEQLEKITSTSGDSDEKSMVDQINDLRMDLLRKGKECIRLEEDLKNEQDARRRYSSPENAIVQWAGALATGEMDRLMKFYSEDNVHRKRFDADGRQREALAREHAEFQVYAIEPDVISIELDPRENRAKARLVLRMTRDGKTVNVKANMVLVREFDRWVILDEGF